MAHADGPAVCKLAEHVAENHAGQRLAEQMTNGPGIWLDDALRSDMGDCGETCAYAGSSMVLLWGALMDLASAHRGGTLATAADLAFLEARILSDDVQIAHCAVESADILGQPLQWSGNMAKLEPH